MYRLPLADIVPAAGNPEGGKVDRSTGGESNGKRVPWQIDLETFAEHPRVIHYLQYFQGPAREHIARSLQRGAPYIGMIQDRLKAANLPTELVNLALIESGFSNTAVSRAGATGMWQLMSPTARAYGLRVDESVDERRDPFKATEAAILHLRDLTERFQSPYLAAAAYNAGTGRIHGGLERLRTTDPAGLSRARPLAAPFDLLAGNTARDGHGDAVYPGDADFFRLSDASLLASETSDFVPKLIATSIMVNDPDNYDLLLPRISPLAFDSVVVTKATRLEEVARIADVPLQILRQLNPQYLRGITPNQARSVIRLPHAAPWGLAMRLAAIPAEPGVQETPLPQTTPELCTNEGEAGIEPNRLGRKLPRIRHAPVRRGDTVEDIAERYGVSEAAVRRINVLPEWYELRPGQILQLPEQESAESPS